MVVDYLNEFETASRSDINKLLMNKISDALRDDQKKNFITNLLQEMRRNGTIEPFGKSKGAKWIMSKSASKSSR